MPGAASSWRVKAWVESPGDFPSWSLLTATVHAPDIDHAIARARGTFATGGLDPILVSAVRTVPAVKHGPDTA